MLTGPLAFYTVASGIATAVDNALNGTVGGRPQRVSIVPGDIAHDACDCGALYVSPGEFFLSDNFPESLSTDTRTTPCEFAWVVSRIVIELMRCAPQPVGSATAPTVQALNVAAQIYVSDAYVVRTSVLEHLCELKSTDTIIDFTISDQTRNGPGGGCVGTTLTAYVALPRD